MAFPFPEGIPFSEPHGKTDDGLTLACLSLQPRQYPKAPSNFTAHRAPAKKKLLRCTLRSFRGAEPSKVLWTCLDPRLTSEVFYN